MANEPTTVTHKHTYQLRYSGIKPITNEASSHTKYENDLGIEILMLY